MQAYLPYVSFLGTQKIGGVAETAQDGFAQPNFSFFFWPIKAPATGTYLVISPWVSPPMTRFNPNVTLNPSAGTPGDAWYEEMEIGARRTLFGAQTEKNLSLELWATGYLYQSNTNFKVPTGTALGTFDATYREQPTLELRAYLPYVFNPATDGVVTAGFFQSFGGKQTLSIPAIGNLPGAVQAALAQNGLEPITDTGQRTHETQLRLLASSFITPSVNVVGYGYYDVAARGDVKERLIGIRIIKIF